MSELATGMGVLAATSGYGALDILLSAMMWVSTSLFVMAIFSQGGEIRMSAEREAAIATGHTDRETVFENQFLRPVLWVMLVVSHRLRLPKFKHWLRWRLIAAGSPNYYTPEEYMALSLAGGVLSGAVLQVVSLMIWGELSVTLMVLGMGAIGGLIIYQLHETATRRLSEIQRRLPYALDLIALAMGAGATFTEATRTLAGEDETDPLNVELRAMLAEVDLGTTRRKSLENLAQRVPIESLGNVVASVVQAEELGSPLGDVLRDQATVLRLRRSYAAENRAAIASVRMLVPILLLVLAVLCMVFGPAILRILQDGLL